MSPEKSDTGRFITLEGGEGAGKSTQIKRLAAALEDKGITVLATREPGGSPGAEQIRKLMVEGEPGRWDAITETLLAYAARADHVARTIGPALRAGRWVISDRFNDSTFAYQGVGRGVPRETIRRIGARPGIWIRPLQATVDTPESWRLPRDRTFLDPSVPEVRQKVADDITRLRQWGFELIKHDYTTFDVFGRWGYQMGSALTRDGWSFASGSSCPTRPRRAAVRDPARRRSIATVRPRRSSASGR